ncbi:MAG: NUDIX hydrolase [Nanoarchaeota archaeon]|nr:NUDIX hydrolase [Nanoarchaeota archaeon]MBU1269951.1 NUDIX hydrolase [Nanoarchaeota archaeon]MBU1604042.1 NUDIX hydrolase [Nanoarchaeota archaeon]MBU2442547.1 NUDIX hydrolase [Nanoarchaeota archaeon]
MSQTIKNGDEVVYKGHITLVKRPYLKKNFDVVLSKDACAIMYIDEQDDVYFVEQYRPAVGKKILELPAETLDKNGKSPLEHAIEGLVEECGIIISPSQVKYVGTIGSSEGHDSEMVYLYTANGPHKKTLPRPGNYERIDVVKLKFDQAYRMFKEGKINGSKSAILLQHEYIKRLEKRCFR